MTKATNAVLNKADFFKLKIKVEKVSIPSLGDVYVKEMKVSDQTAYAKAMKVDGVEDNLTALLFIYSVCDAEGNLLFTEDDIEAINGLPVSITGTVSDKIMSINGLSPNAVEVEAKN